MHKLIASALVLVASFQIGLGQSRKLTQRVQCLEQLEHLLILFLGQVKFGLRPLGEIFESLGKEDGGEVFLFAFQEMERRDGRSARDCFCSAVNTAYPLLTKEDTAVLLSLGEGLGVSDNQTQCRLIESVMAELTARRKQAQEYAAKNSKLYQGLSITGGLFLILLFL